MSAKDKQVGGSHYKDYAIQPVEFIQRNGLGFLEGCVIKRMCRWRAKNGLEDLRKAIHEIELLIEQEEGAETDENRGAMVENAVCQAKERLAVKLGHPMIGDHLTQAAEAAVLAYLDAKKRAPNYELNTFYFTSRTPAKELALLANGTPVSLWGRVALTGRRGRPRMGWVDTGFVWDGELVPHEAPR